MSGRLWLFSSKIERDAAFPEGPPSGLQTGITGVGPVDAGIMTAELLARLEPDEIVYLGTCGAYPNSRIGIGDVVAAGSVRLGSGDTVRGEMRIPKLLPDELQTEPALTGSLLHGISDRTVSTVSVLCTLGVTENEGLAEILGAVGEVENLEIFSVLRASGPIPTAAILGVTNIVGEGGGRDWMANYKEMMREVGALCRFT